MKALKRQISGINKSIVATFILLAFITATFAQGKIDVSDQIKLVTEFEVNGLKVLVKSRENAPTVAASLFVKGGTRNITDKNAGIEAFTLQAATEGSKAYSREVVRRTLATTGSAVGAGVNKDYSSFSFVSTRQNFDKTWDVFADLAMNPSFEKDDVERLRQQFLTGLKNQESDNDNFLDVLQRRVVYAKHPYENDVSGTVKTIEGFTPKDLSDYHKKIMQTSQLLLVVVGDIQAEELKKKVSATLGKLPKGNYKEKALPKFDFSESTIDITKREVPTNYIRGIFEAPSIDNPDYFAMNVATSILSTLFFQEVRERRQLTYAASAEVDSFIANSGNIYVTTTDPNQSVDIMLQLVKFVQNQKLNPDAIKGIAGFFLTKHYMSNETNSAQVSDLAKYELTGGGWKNSFEFLNGVQSVTPEDVQRVTKKYMNNFRFVYIGDPSKVNKEIFLRKKR